MTTPLSALPSASLLASLLPPATGSSDSSQIAPGVQNTLDAVGKVEAIPQQLQAQSRKWAVGELSHLINELHVTLEADPGSEQGIANDAEQIANGDGFGSSESESSSVDGSEQSNGFSLSFQETESISQSQVTIGGQTASETVINQSEDLQIQVEQQDSSAEAGVSNDVNLLQQASVAIGQALQALQSQDQSNPGQAQNIVSGADDTLRSLFGNIGTDLLSSLSGLQPSSGVINLTA
jgi:hypothetical protein